MAPLKDVQIVVRVEPRLRDELRSISEDTGRTFSEEVRRALRIYVMNLNGKVAA